MTPVPMASLALATTTVVTVEVANVAVRAWVAKATKVMFANATAESRKQTTGIKICEVVGDAINKLVVAVLEEIFVKVPAEILAEDVVKVLAGTNGGHAHAYENKNA